MFKLLKSLVYKLDRLIFNHLVKNRFILFFENNTLGDDYIGWEDQESYYDGWEEGPDYYYELPDFVVTPDDDDFFYGDPMEDFGAYEWDMGFDEMMETYDPFDYDPDLGFEFDDELYMDLQDEGINPDAILDSYRS